VGKENCRSLGFARDDKGEGSAHLISRYEGWTERQQVSCDFHPLRFLFTSHIADLQGGSYL
jgi:hypothetical protein